VASTFALRASTRGFVVSALKSRPTNELFATLDESLGCPDPDVGCANERRATSNERVVRLRLFVAALNSSLGSTDTWLGCRDG
jgi:hypothetical protein